MRSGNEKSKQTPIMLASSLQTQGQLLNRFEIRKRRLRLWQLSDSGCLLFLDYWPYCQLVLFCFVIRSLVFCCYIAKISETRDYAWMLLGWSTFGYISWGFVLWPPWLLSLFVAPHMSSVMSVEVVFSLFYGHQGSQKSLMSQALDDRLIETNCCEV